MEKNTIENVKTGLGLGVGTSIVLVMGAAIYYGENTPWLVLLSFCVVFTSGFVALALAQGV